MAPNDNGSFGQAIDLRPAFPAGLSIYGRTFNTFYLNTNGNITFNAALPTFTPAPFPVADQPMIAPWWADVDTRGGGQPTNNSICFAIQPNRVVVTWVNVGYSSSHNDRLNHFQLVLLDRSDTGLGGLDIEFRYARCEWTTGDSSGGTGGFGGTAAQAGFDAGDRMNYVTLPWSRSPGILDLCRTSNLPGGPPGVWRFSLRGGRLVP